MLSISQIDELRAEIEQYSAGTTIIPPIFIIPGRKFRRLMQAYAQQRRLLKAKKRERRRRRAAQRRHNRGEI